MTFNRPVVFSGFLHQFKNREDIADIFLTVTLNTITLTPNTENIYKMIKRWDNRANESGLGTTYYVFYSFSKSTEDVLYVLTLSKRVTKYSS